MTTTAATPPHDLQSERALLSAMLVGEEAVRLACDRLTGPEFYFIGHQRIFRAIRSLRDHGQAVDLLAVVRGLQSDSGAMAAVDGLDPEANGAGYIAQLVSDSEFIGVNVPARCERIQQLAALRGLGDSLTRLSQRTTSDPNADPAQIAEEMRQALESINGETQGSSFILRSLRSGPQLRDADLKPPQPLLGNGLLAAGEFAMLHSATGLGKTFLAEQLGFSLASGKAFLDQFWVPPEGVPVVSFQLELSPWRLRERRKHRYADYPPDRLYTTTAEDMGRPISILDPSDFNAVVRALQATQAKVVIFDPLHELHDEPETNETFHLVVRAFRRLSIRTGAAVIAVHHEGKESTDPRMKRSDLDADRGGTRLGGGAKLKLRLKELPNGCHVLVFAKTSFGPKPSDLYLARDEYGWWIPSQPPEDPGDKTLALVERLLLAAGSDGMSYEQLASSSQRTVRSLRTHLTRLAVLHGLRGQKDLNVGKANRPVFVHPSVVKDQRSMQAEIGGNRGVSAFVSDDSESNYIP